MGSCLASAFLFSHVDVRDPFTIINHICGSIPARVRAPIVFFFTHTRRRRVTIYKSYMGGLPHASALSFLHVDIDDAF